MKIISFLLAGTLFFATAAGAVELPENLSLGTDRIHVISSFKEVTFFTVYTYAGEPVWEMPFSSEILSWKAKDGQLLIFSRARNGQACFLSSIDASSGKLQWEKAIIAPGQ
jgi:hypothetical protein